MLPDFFVAGAQKSGTTSLCSILRVHPDIFMSRPKELFFFDQDDYIAHPIFFMDRRNQWQEFNWNKDKGNLLECYKQIFEQAPEGAICGEGSTTYMSSNKAPERIAEVIPDAKIVFILRDPVDRAYSAYWHLVVTGRSIHTFEKHLKFEPNSLLYNGLYKKHLERYLEKFPRSQLHIIVFELFTQNMQQEVDKLCAFLGAEVGVDVNQVKLRRNTTPVPRVTGLHLILNLLGRVWGTDVVSRSFACEFREKRYGVSEYLLNHIRYWNLKAKQYPPMKPGTRRHLEEFYRRENEGLSDLVGVDFAKHWSCMG